MELLVLPAKLGATGKNLIFTCFPFSLFIFIRARVCDSLSKITTSFILQLCVQQTSF